MKKTIKINNQGFSVGSVGWLLSEIDTIKINITQDGAGLGAWLKNKEGKTIVMLACQNYFSQEEQGKITLCDRRSDPFTPGMKHEVTDACWYKIQELSEMAKELIIESVKNDPTDKKITFITK